MRIVIIERAGGAWTRSDGQGFDLVEVGDDAALATTQPVVEAESAEAYARSAGLIWAADMIPSDI